MNLKRVLIIAASVMVLAASTAFAAMEHHGPGSFGLFGPKVVAQLHLNSTQTQALNSIQAERKAMFTQLRAQHQTMVTSMETTLKSDNPDLRSLAQQSDAVMDQMRQQTRKIRDDELNLYDTLTPQQKAVVRASLLKRMSFMQKHRAWKQGHSGANTDSSPSTTN